MTTLSFDTVNGLHQHWKDVTQRYLVSKGWQVADDGWLPPQAIPGSPTWSLLGAIQWQLQIDGDQQQRRINMLIPETQRDDQQRVTLQWWRQAYPDQVAGYLKITGGLEITVFPAGENQVEICVSDGYTRLSVPLPQIETRGHLRLLLAVLGYQLPDDSRL